MVKQAKRKPVEIEDLFRLRVITGASLSPDGRRLVFALQRQDLSANKAYSSLYEVPARGGRMRRLTQGNLQDTSPRFSPDGRHVAFLSNRGRVRGIWLLPLSGGEPRRLTDPDGNVDGFDWSPDSRHVVFSRRLLGEREKLVRDRKREQLARLPDFRHVDRLSYKADGTGIRPEARSHICLSGIRGGRTRQLTDGEWDDGQPRFSPDGGRVAFLSNRLPDCDRLLGNADVYTVGTDGTGLRKVTREEGPALGARWSPDGRRIYYIGHTGGSGDAGRTHLHPRSVAAGGGPSVDLAPGLDRHAMNFVIGDVAGTDFGGPLPALDESGERLYFAVSDRGACHLASVPASGGEVAHHLAGDLTVLDFGIGAGGAAWAVVGEMTNPGDLYRLDLAGGTTPQRLTRVNDKVLRGLDVVEPEEVTYASPGGRVHGWVLKPPRWRKGRKYPLVLEVHGGPQVAYGHVFFHEMQLLASRGYVVLMTNPRGGDGYGADHRTAILRDWGNKDRGDLMAAVSGLIAEGFVDESRCYLTGGSYGGFMTNWLVAHTDRFRAAVTQRSVVDFESFFGTSDIGYRFEHHLGGTPWEIPETYRKLSPLHHAGKIRTPLLILHSEEDHRCPVSQAEQLFVKLRMLGKEVEMVRFAGESHGLSRGGRPQNRAERLRRILDWFGRHGGRSSGSR